jgi:AAHS family 4-hydroxybenzoate transporter-like MFS transporter
VTGHADLAARRPQDANQGEGVAAVYGGGIAVGEYLDGLRITSFHVAIFLICALVALMDGYDSAVIGMTGTSIATSLNLDIKQFGPVFAAAQFGFMIGGFLGGPIADRRGRKRTLVVATLLFGVGAVVTVLATGLLDLIAYRFVTGLGLGAAATCFVSLCSEYAPRRARGLIVASLWALVPTGTIVAGVFASIVLPRQGWTMMYFIGGAIPLVSALLIALIVPESVKFLANRERNLARVRSILARLSAGAEVPAELSAALDPKTAGRPLAYLSGRDTVSTTLGLWVSFFCVWLILVTILAWISPLLQQEGLSTAQASLVIASNSVGGVIGIIAVGRLIDLYDKYRVNIVMLLAGAVAATAFAFVHATFATAVSFCFVMGLTVGGASGGLTALAAIAYPVAIRSTGVGWAMGMARFGAAMGPLLGGAIISHNGGREQVFLVLAACAAIAAIALVGIRSRRSPQLMSMNEAPIAISSSPEGKRGR